MQSRYEELPRYRLIVPFYGPDDVRHVEDEEIEWDGPPNEQMEPLNDAAERRMREYLSALPPSASMPRAGGTPDLADIVEAAMQNRPRYPEQRANASPIIPTEAKERVLAALARDEIPDPADLAALSAAAQAVPREIEMPRKDPTVPFQGTVPPPEGTSMRRRGRQPGQRGGMVRKVGDAATRRRPTRIMGGLREVGPEASMVGEGLVNQLTPGSRITTTE